ncbi:inositol monophosphatase family protein [Gammaproteobacteria bacterium]|nr:inositol monophosphatase family protein [Gammaproteobacteria bacterium]
MHPFVNTAIRAARQAGRILEQGFRQLDRIAIEEKGPNDLVSNVDRASEETIASIILKAYPDHRILGEESGDSGGDSDYQWIIDPLDGTTNFLHGHPHFCISIASAYRGRVEHAVIFDPLRNELFVSTRGSGVQLDSRRLRVDGRRAMKQGLIATGFGPSASHGEIRRWSAITRQVAMQSRGIRRDGAAALDLAWVAAGRLDGFYEAALNPWDYAAGVLMVREAGGIVSTYDGGDMQDVASCICGGTRVHRELLGIVQGTAASA